MKHLLLLFTFLAATTALCSTEPENFQVLLEPLWKDLENNAQKAQDFGGRWILAGSITFKKRAKDTLHLNKIYLQWKGQTIDGLIASLYLKDDDEKFMPIQDNLVCDGVWSKNNQTLMLNFEEQHTLGPTNIFYLVLTVPTDLELVLKDGSFKLLPSHLPEPYKMAARQNHLSIAYEKLPEFPKALGPNRKALHPANCTHVAIDVVVPNK
jgi:hypothetical protein